ncbi:MAG: O-antigen ligase family protein [Aeromonadaceae bacterium]
MSTFHTTEALSPSLMRLVQILVFCFGALCLAVPGGYSISFITLFFISLAYLGRYQLTELSPLARPLCWTLLLVFATQALAIGLDGGILKNYDRISRLLGLVFMLPLLCRYRPSFHSLMRGIGIGALGAGGVALFDKFVRHSPRAFDDMMPIQSGDISLSLGLLSLCAMAWAYRERKQGEALFYLIATLFGMLGSLLSGSRGGWILLPLILLAWYRLFCPWFSRRIKLTLLSSLLLLGLLSTLPQFGVALRLAEAKQDMALYLSDGNQNTSLGYRLQFWRSAWHSFVEKPLLGWGPKSIRHSQEQQYKAGELSQAAFAFNSHAHNQYLDQMAKYGLVGLGCLLALFFVPLTLARRLLKQQGNARCYTLAAAAIIHVLATMDYCLSQAFLNHNSGIIFYPFLMVLLLLAAEAEQSRPATEKPPTP